ncbi:MAG: Uma2 family endonuclease [Isosphaeraceae bacterium]
MSQSVRDRASRGTRRHQATIPLVMPAGVRVSERGFWRICRANPDLRLERNANGELIVMPPAGMDSSRRNMSIGAQLWYWNQRSGLGIAFDSSAGFTLPNTAIRGPDASWMTRERWDALPQRERERFSHICPDFVVELRSKTDEMNTLRKKMEEYIGQGVRLGWLIDPKGGTVEIYRPGRPVETLERPVTLSGEDVLPGFVLELRGILFD